MRSLRSLLRGRCNGRTYHVWSQDPTDIGQSAFKRVDCVYCDYSVDAVAMTNTFRKHDLPIPGRVADPDELAAWRERREVRDA